jgi:hypothetical protein
MKMMSDCNPERAVGNKHYLLGEDGNIDVCTREVALIK